MTIPGINNKCIAGSLSYLIYYPLHPNYKNWKGFHYIYTYIIIIIILGGIKIVLGAV